MTFRARVHLQRPGATVATDIGDQELGWRPIRYGRTEFWYDGKTQVGRVEQIDPTDWDARGVVPAVLIVQRL
jgi:hypothetical protein